MNYYFTDQINLEELMDKKDFQKNLSHYIKGELDKITDLDSFTDFLKENEYAWGFLDRTEKEYHARLSLYGIACGIYEGKKPTIQSDSAIKNTECSPSVEEIYIRAEEAGILDDRIMTEDLISALFNLEIVADRYLEAIEEERSALFDYLTALTHYSESGFSGEELLCAAHPHYEKHLEEELYIVKPDRRIEVIGDILDLAVHFQFKGMHAYAQMLVETADNCKQIHIHMKTVGYSGEFARDKEHPKQDTHFISLISPETSFLQ
jgi:hypothetical protein